MGCSPSKVPHSPFKSAVHSPYFDKKTEEKINHNGTINSQDNNAAIKEDSAKLEQQNSHPTKRHNLTEHRGERDSLSPDANHTKKNVGLQNDLRKRPKRTNLQATYRPCLLLEIKVLRGHDITLGSFHDFFDTPDPYVKLHIPTAPNGRRRTKAISDNPNPTWDEVFHFYLDPNKMNLLQITLMDSDTLIDDLVEIKTFDLGTLELHKTCHKTFTFQELSKVDVEMKIEPCTTSADMRYSMDLCQEEEKFLMKRKQFVFESMRTFLGERGPQSIDEIPTVAVLGSGGGYRAMVSLSSVFCALKDMGVLDCTMYAAGLSGSAWYLSTLYSHPEWPHAHPRVIRNTLQENINDTNFMRLLIAPSWMYKHLKILQEKKRRGQPVSLTDLFGHGVADTILKDRDEIPKLSDQRRKIEDAVVPFPLYTCVHVKKDVPAKEYGEWVEFSPYEIGIARYGTFMKTEYFGSKFFCGKRLVPYPEPPLHYLLGLWGSAFTIVLQRVLREGKLPDDAIEEMSNPGDPGEELREMIDGHDDDDDDDDDDEDSDSDNEKDEDDIDTQNNNSNNTRFENKDKEERGFFGRFFEVLVDKLAIFKTRRGRAGLIHNFLRGLQVLTAPNLSGEDDEDNDVVEAADELALTSSHIYLVDSGLVFNSPFPPLLRPERKVDVLLSFDFSTRKRDVEFPFEELLLAEKWARENNIKFPPIQAELQYKKHGMKEFYVFRDPKDPTCPTVIHFVLVNRTFKEEIRPGISRETKEEMDYANFSLFENGHYYYGTFNFHYREREFNRLADLNEYNTLLGEKTIKDIMAECIKRRRRQRAQSS